MNKNDFMQGLRVALATLPWEEYQSAMKYYEEYFADAGEDREEDIIAELGSPEEVAATIMSDYSSAPIPAAPGAAHGQASNENPHRGEASQQNAAGYADAAYSTATGTTSDYSGGTAQGFGGLPTWAIVAFAILLLPIWLPLAGGLLAVLFGLLAVVFSLLLSAAIVGVAFLLGGILCVVVGATRLFFSPAGGLITMGGGLILLGLSIPLAMATVWLFAKAVPAIIRSTAALVRRIFHRK